MLTSELKLEEYTCTTRMIWKTALRYTQFWLLLALVSSQLTREQEKQILDLHNQYRGVVNPKAADMRQMIWNETLAVVARGYAAQCIWDHNVEVTDKLGENLFITTGNLIVNESITKWFDEYKMYDYATNICSKICGHYTQVVWAKTSAVGCASHLCKTVEGNDFENATIVVCNYYPQGNIYGAQPYKAGDPCSKCPDEMSACVENTCAHNPKVESRTVTWQTDARRTQPANSARFTKLSVATLPLAGLVVSFVF